MEILFLFKKNLFIDVDRIVDRIGSHFLFEHRTIGRTNFHSPGILDVRLFDDCSQNIPRVY